MRHSRTLNLTLSLLLVSGAAWAAGDRHHAEGGHHSTFTHMSDADMETYDLSELADGERREFGTDEHTIVAERAGETITITMPSRDGGATKTFQCRVGGDSCVVKLMNGDSKHKMMLIRKSGDGSVEDHELIVKTLSGDSGMVWIDDEGNDFQLEGENMMFFGEGEDGEAGAHPKMRVMRMHHGDPDQVVMACPEGDTTMKLHKDEADVAYTCPKHGVPLVKQEMNTMIKKIIEIHHAEEHE